MVLSLGDRVEGSGLQVWGLRLGDLGCSQALGAYGVL